MNRFAKLLLYALLAVAAYAQTPTLTITGPNGNIKAGSTIQLTVSITGASGLNIAGVQGALSLIGTSAPCSAGFAATAAAKTLDCSVRSGSVLFLVSGVNALWINDGPLANIQMVVPTTAQAGTYTVALTGASALSANLGGNPVATGVGAPFTFGITDPCDANGSGTTDQADVNLVKQQILTGVGTFPDLTGDGVVNIVDLQRVINAALPGGTCVKTP